MDLTQSPEYPLDPFPYYERMRAAAPVFQDDQSGSWHVFRYDDVQRVLSEHATFSSRMGATIPPVPDNCSHRASSPPIPQGTGSCVPS